MKLRGVGGMATSADVKSIFGKALEEADPAARAVYLTEACGDDAALRAEVEGLLEALENAGRFMTHPAMSAPMVPSATDEAIGSMIGPYKLLQKLGEGGMGTVYLAEQEQPVKRQVALKVIKAGMDSRHIIARFEQERQALAMMEHPNIAKVLDAGTIGASEPEALATVRTSVAYASGSVGRPYVVMELVKGVPITRYCDQARLTPKERLSLFIPVCQAVQHAHQKGIIHRDLKPSNVLIALYDGVPIPKVIDFGVAKAIGPARRELVEQSLFTEVGMLVGTLEYMAPEQAELNNLDIDTRADIYSLGVILYELLTGSPPFTAKQFRDAGFSEVLRLIREVEPPKPSTKLSSSVELPSIAATRKLEPKSLTKLMTGELDWIVMKCLEKERGRRYETANGLGLDLQRYLADEPVSAGPPSARYRLRKFAHKHRKLISVVGAFALLLAGGAAISTWQAIRATIAERATAHERDKALAEKQRADEEAVRATIAERETAAERDKVVTEKERADEEAAISKAVNEFLQHDLLGQADIANQPAGMRDQDIKVRELLDRAAVRIESRFKRQELVEAAIRLTLGKAYQALGEFAEAQKHLERSHQLRQQKLGAAHRDTLDSIHALAFLHNARGEDAETERLLSQVWEGRKVTLGADHHDTLQAANDLAGCYANRSRYGDAESLRKMVLEKRRAQLGPDHLDTLASEHGMANLYQVIGKYSEAEPLYSHALQGRRANLGDDHPLTLLIMKDFAALCEASRRFDKAEELFKEVVRTSTAKLGADHPQTLMGMNGLAVLYQSMDRYEEAEKLLMQVLKASRAKLGENHWVTLSCLNNIGTYYSLLGRPDEALTYFQQALNIRRARYEADHPDLLVAIHNLGTCYRDARRYDEAEPLLLEAAAGTKRKLGLAHPTTQTVIQNLADLHNRQGKPQLAEPHLREIAEFHRLHSGPESQAYDNQLGWLFGNLMEQKKFADAEVIARERLATRVKNAPDTWALFFMKSLLAKALMAQEKYGESEPLLLQAHEGMKNSTLNVDAIQSARLRKERLIETIERLIALYEATGKKDEAAKWKKELEARRAPDAAP